MDLGGATGPALNLASCPNVSPLIEAVIRSGKATLYECQTIYGLEDLYDIMEVVMVGAYNDAMIAEASRKNR